jgi:hypothetical protein
MHLELRIGALALLAMGCFAQETRSVIAGRITDPSGSAVPGATVRVTHVDTNTTAVLQTNETGYYEANLLLPGNYRLAVEAAGFKQAVRAGLTLPVASRIDVNIQLEIGAQAETISVTAEAPLIDVSAVSSGRVMDNRNLMDLPVLGNSAILLVKLTPGIQTSGVNNYLGLHSNIGGSDYNVNGNVGGNEWTIDGVPNNGNSRRAAYLPYSDTLAEFKVETSNFDASIGHTTGASIAMITKSGSNAFHGTLTEQHWQQRWNGSPFFVKQQYYRRIAEAEAAGNKALADEIRRQDKQPSGHSNNWAATIGGPVVIPKIFSGRNRLFFFFSYNGFKDVKTEDASSINRTVPTAAEREGDFSQLLNVDPVRYQLYDPLTTRPDPANPGHFIRSPFAGNLIPRNRFQNPVYGAYVKLIPLPNNPQPANREQRNNYLAIGTPYNWDYKAFSNRMDYNISERHRVFGRWSFNDFLEDRGDWTYETARGLHTNGLNRNNKGATIDWVWTKSSATIFDFAVAANQFREGDRITVPLKYKPSDVGFPKYIDEKAGAQHILPFIDFDASYQDIGRGGIPTFTRYRMMTSKVDVTHIRGRHSWRGGFDARQHFRTGGGGGNTSGNYSFRNTFTRGGSDSARFPAGDFGHQWASFLMGFPSSMTIATNDSYAMHNPYYAWYVQDNWRVAPRLSLNLGFRIEFENGPTERYNRMIGSFDRDARLPISAAAEAAYAADPLPELPAANFKVRGGSIYPGSQGADRRLWRGQWMFMPRLGVAYQIAPHTVIKAGYGMSYDTLNVLNDGPTQTNFSRTTSTVITNDFGVTWNVADPPNGKPPITDPFPVRANGTRYDVPTRDALGLMAIQGRNFTFDDFHRVQRARQQRWRAAIQHQIGSHMVVEVAYAGSYSDNVYLNRHLNFLPEAYWAGGMTRNNEVATRLNANVTNPFHISNFESLRQTNPLAYDDLQTQGFFTSRIIARHRLLRPYPNLGTDVIFASGPFGEARTDALEVSFERRMYKGWNFNLGYTATNGREADIYLNQFDERPSWRPSNDTRPHRFIATSIYELPFGKGRAFFQRGLPNHLLGGWQIGVTYEWQPGPLLDWGNLFYFGDLGAIRAARPTLDRWFNATSCSPAVTSNCFVTNSTQVPAAFHRRVFPTRIDGVRRDWTNQWNANIQREIRLREGLTAQLRLDALNVQNRSQFNAPDTNPLSTNFGRVTSQTAATNRFLQIQIRLRF